MSKKKLIIGIFVLIIAVAIFCVSFYFYSLGKVKDTKNNTIEYFTVSSGTSTDVILKNLQSKGLINSVPIAKLYIKLNKLTLKAGSYELKYNMSTEEILKILALGGEKVQRITFVEGKRISHYLKIINDEFGLSEDEMKEKLNDRLYLQTLIDKYWFLTEEILNKDIYFPLEGYLFPDTYEFRKDTTIEEIVEKMLDGFENRLKIYKDTIEDSEYSVHEIISMASIIELEGNTPNDRKRISQVIYNRLEKNMNLGMDVTTYYAVGKEMGETLYKSELNSFNPYNTRSVADMFGKLPVGPICNPGLISIDAVLNPTANNYLYFYAEIKTGAVHFAETSEEFAELIKKYS